MSDLPVPQSSFVLQEAGPWKQVYGNRPVPESLQRIALRYPCSEKFLVYLALNEDRADFIEKRNLKYLELPPLIASVAASPFYTRALHHGRGWYFDAMHDIDEQGKVFRDPLVFERAEIFEMVREGVCPQEKAFLFQPLAWRVGFQVGWLSALSVSQKEDVQAAMVLLAALVAPLLVDQPAASSQSVTKQLPVKAKSKARHHKKLSSKKR